MSIVTAQLSRHPALLFVAPAQEQLDVIACLEERQGLQILWHECCRLPVQSSLQLRLTEIGKLHVIPPETRAVLLVPPGIGGLFASPSTQSACSNPGWCMRQLELFVPYRHSEIRYIVRYKDGKAHFFWVPVAWLDSQVLLFSKLGLKLSEVYPRALLFEGSQTRSGYSGMLSEKLERGEFRYEFKDGCVCQALLLPVETDLPLQDVNPDPVVNDGKSITAPPSQGAPDWKTDLPVLWQNTELSIPVATGRLTLWRPFFQIAAAMLLVLATLIGFLSWQTTAKEDALAKATRERKLIAESSNRFLELEKTVRVNEAVVTTIKKIHTAPTPLALLAQLAKILPKKAWIQQLTFEGKGIVVSGKGVGDDELIGLFLDAGLLVEKMRQEPSEESNDFRLRIADKPKPIEGVSGGAS